MTLASHMAPHARHRLVLKGLFGSNERDSLYDAEYRAVLEHVARLAIHLADVGHKGGMGALVDELGKAAGEARLAWSVTKPDNAHPVNGASHTPSTSPRPLRLPGE